MILLKYTNNCIKSYTIYVCTYDFFKLIINLSNNFFIEQFFVRWLLNFIKYIIISTYKMYSYIQLLLSSNLFNNIILIYIIWFKWTILFTYLRFILIEFKFLNGVWFQIRQNVNSWQKQRNDPIIFLPFPWEKQTEVSEVIEQDVSVMSETEDRTGQHLSPTLFLLAPSYVWR